MTECRHALAFCATCTELHEPYEPPKRDGQRQRVAATGGAFYGPNDAPLVKLPERNANVASLTERLNSAGTEREHSRARHDYIPRTEQRYVTPHTLHRAMDAAVQEEARRSAAQAKRNANVAPQHKRQTDEELDALIAAMVANPSAYLDRTVSA